MAAYDHSVYGMNGFAIGLSEQELHGRMPKSRPRDDEEAYCVVVFTGTELSKEKKEEFRKAADELVKRKTDESDIVFRVITKVDFH